MTWVPPATTLGGAGMWDSIRTNGLYQLQRYKMEGTAFEGLFTQIRKVYSEAPNYRIIAVDHPYWEIANGHSEQQLQAMMTWLDVHLIPRLQQTNLGGFAQGSIEAKIRIIRDFMQSYVTQLGSVNLDPFTDQSWASVISHMALAPNIGNSQVGATIITQSAAPTQPKPTVIAAAPSTAVVQPLPPIAPSSHAVPITNSQLVTRLERDPTTGQLRYVQVYQPVSQPMAQPGYPGYQAPPPAAQFAPPPGYPQPVFVSPATGKLPSNVSVYPQARSPSGSSIAAPPSAVYPGNFSAQPPQRHPSQANVPPSVVAPNPYVVPNAYIPPSSGPSNAYPPQPQRYPPSNPVSQAPPASNPSYPPQGLQQSYSQAPPQQNPAAPSYAQNNASPAFPPAAQPESSPALQPASNFNPSIPVSQWDAQKESSQAMPTSPDSHGALTPLLPSAPAEDPILPFATPSPSAPLAEGVGARASPTPTSNTTDEDKNLCKLCFERDLDCAFLPCSHVACHQCTTTLNLKKCPFCRTDISQVLKLYRA